MPTKVIVAGVNYTVTEKDYVEINDNANALGLCVYDKSVIEVKSTMSGDRKEEVFIHELFHAILFEAGFDEHDEDMVNRASKVLYQVLKDNPNLLNPLANVTQINISGTLSEDEIKKIQEYATLEITQS